MEKKHKIFKYSSFWYFTCAWCAGLDVLPGKTFGHVIYLSRDHVESKHRDLLTQPLTL
jgi:hypothetical protein